MFALCRQCFTATHEDDYIHCKGYIYGHQKQHVLQLQLSPTYIQSLKDTINIRVLDDHGKKQQVLCRIISRDTHNVYVIPTVSFDFKYSCIEID